MTSITKFWNWFIKKNKAYTFLNDVDEDDKERLMDELLEQLHQYSENLYFEIGGMPGEDVELIITATGNLEYFDEVETLVNNAPKIPGWRFISFKPATPDNFTSNWEGLNLNTEDIWFGTLTNKKQPGFGIRVYLKNYDSIKDDERLEPLVYTILETIVGEKSFAVDLEYIDTDLQPNNPEKKALYPIIDLPEHIRLYKEGSLQ